MSDKDPSLSINQRVDNFKRDLGNILRGFTGHSNDTMPPRLPTPIKSFGASPAKSAVSHSEKGTKSDESD